MANGGYTGMASIGGPGEYGEEGVGNTTAPFREVTRPGMFPNGNTGSGRSQGETPGAGSIHMAVLSERPNISNLRNHGPMRAPSMAGSTPIDVVTTEQRKTGRI